MGYILVNATEILDCDYLELIACKIYHFPFSEVQYA